MSLFAVTVVKGTFTRHHTRSPLVDQRTPILVIANVLEVESAGVLRLCIKLTDSCCDGFFSHSRLNSSVNDH